MSDVYPPLVVTSIKNICDEAQIAIRAKEWQIAFEILRKALQHDELDWPLQAFLDLGTAATQLGRFAEAGLAYGTARKRDAQSVAAWSGGAFAASRRGAWEEAVHLWQGCMALSPKESQPEWWWSSFGEALVKLERWEEAASAYATIRARWPDRPLGWRGGAFVASRVADWMVAADLWQGCMARSSVDGQQFWWWSSLADAQSRLGRAVEAASAYEHLRQRWPDNIAGWQGGARLATLTGDWDNAAALWRLGMERVPGAASNPASVASAIHAQLRAGHWNVAKSLFDEMLGRCSEDPSGMPSLLRLIAKDFGARRAARIFGEMGLFRMPPSPSYEKQLLEILLQAGRYSLAADRISQLSAKNDEDALWLSVKIAYHQAMGEDHIVFAEVKRALDNTEYHERFTADEVALLAYKAALDLNEAKGFLRQWYSESLTREAVHKVYSLPLASPETTGSDWQPSTLSKSWEDWNKKCREKFRRYQTNRRHSYFRDFVEQSVKRASSLRLSRLLTVSCGRFPNSSTSTRLKAIVENRTIPASDHSETIGSRWRIALPPPELSIVSQLKGRAWRRLVCVVPIRNEDEILESFIEHYKKLGVWSFIVIDNGSDADPAGLLNSIRDCEITLVRAPGRFSDARHGVMWINEIAELGICDWLLLSDCDERFIYPGSTVMPIDKLLDHLDSLGDTALYGAMLDVFDATFAAGGRISDDIGEHNLINADLDSEASLRSPWINIQGGIRSSLATNLEKTPLFKVSAGVRCIDNHHVTSCQLAETSGAFLHLKLFRDRKLLDLSPEQVAEDSRVRNRARNCVARHLAFQSLADRQDRTSPFQVAVSEAQLMKMGYMRADASLRAKLDAPLPENHVAKADLLRWPGRKPLSRGTRFRFRSIPLPEAIEELCHAAHHLSRADLRILIRSHFARISRREVKLAVMLTIVAEQCRFELAKRILRLLRTSTDSGPPCVAALIAAAERLKPYRALEQALLEMALRAGHRAPDTLATLAGHYSWAGHYTKAKAILVGVEISMTDGTLSAQLRALQGIGDWDSYVDLLRKVLSGPAEQPHWRLLSLITQCPFPAEREELLNKLLGRLNPSMTGAAASVYLSVLLMLGKRDKLDIAFTDLAEGLPREPRRYFERVVASRKRQVVYNRFWCLGLSKTGTTSFHDYCKSIGLLSAHFTNPYLHSLITREDADLFDMVSDTSVVHLARSSSFPEGRSIIHTTRRFDDWSRSYLYHFGRVLGLPKATFEDLKGRFMRNDMVRFGSTWIDIHSELYFRFNSLREAYDYHHDWVRDLARTGVPFLEVPLEAPNEVKAEMISRFVGYPELIAAYPVSNQAHRI
jgi:tetratricopeptide (TPR) repeat protein